MIGKGATPSFFAIANDNYTLTVLFLFVKNSYKLHNKQNTVRNYERAN